MTVGLSVATMYVNVQNFVWLPWQPFKSRTLISWGLFVTTTRSNTELLVHNHIGRINFYPRPVLSFGYCRCLRLSVCVCVRQPRAFPRHKSPHVQARTIKFGQKVQNYFVKVPIVFGGDWPWPSRSNLTWKAKFTPFSACPRYNSPHIQARTIKFGQKM